jgi:glycoprotein endo-alpha-1,2-mannosidase
MKIMIQVLILSAGVLFGCSCSDNDLVEDITKVIVAKTNPMKVYMHYMPWYQSKSISGYWGSHWRMTNKNPEIVDANGKRQIASHYYPLIGPYDTQDPDVIDYHLLLMKYAGVDGILIDWYGTHAVYDYKINLIGSNAVIDKLDDVGLNFAIVYEEYTAESVASQTGKAAIEAAQDDMSYMQSNYFGKKEYITIGGKPLLTTFGPRFFKQESQWDQILSKATVKPSLVGKNSSGEFAWIDFKNNFADLTNFYSKSSSYEIMMGSAFPRFHDYYKEGGTGTSYGYVDFNNGQTLKATLQKAKDSNLKYLQLVTWNDFGEGTVMEPTLEDGYQCLEMIQQFTGVPYTKSELELIHDYYIKRTKYKGDVNARLVLDKAFNHLSLLEVDQAREQLNRLQ